MTVDSQSKRIALYGGAFDPVHLAHMTVARAALVQEKLHEVVFMPSAQSPLKESGPVASDQDRLKMLKFAFAGEPRFSVDDFELRRGGISYTVDTVRAYRERNHDAELFLIIGADQLAILDRWREIECLVAMVTFLVLARPAYELAAPAMSGLKWIRVEAPLRDESSTEVRNRISNAQPVSGLLPGAVETFIRENRLYK